MKLVPLLILALSPLRWVDAQSNSFEITAPLEQNFQINSLYTEAMSMHIDGLQALEVDALGKHLMKLAMELGPAPRLSPEHESAFVFLSIIGNPAQLENFGTRTELTRIFRQSFADAEFTAGHIHRLAAARTPHQPAPRLPELANALDHLQAHFSLADINLKAMAAPLDKLFDRKNEDETHAEPQSSGGARPHLIAMPSLITEAKSISPFYRVMAEITFNIGRIESSLSRTASGNHPYVAAEVWEDIAKMQDALENAHHRASGNHDALNAEKDSQPAKALRQYVHDLEFALQQNRIQESKVIIHKIKTALTSARA